MKTIDLSQEVSENMPVYPQTEPPQLSTVCTLEQHSFVEKKIIMHSHIGTHVDAAAHILPDGKTLDAYPLSQFWGRGLVLNVLQAKEGLISLDDLEPYEQAIKAADFVLLYTGWSVYWGQQSYFSGFPILTPKAAEWLTAFDLKGIGVDAPSLDPGDVTDFVIHKVFLNYDMVVIENLTSLKPLIGHKFTFFTFPLKMSQAEGSPVRAVAILDNF